MSTPLTFDTAHPPMSGNCTQLTPLIRRIVANNPTPVTVTGTCSYIVGRGHVAIIDPGPLLDTHIEAILQAVRQETVTHILVSHTHKDHSPAAAVLKEKTGATIVGCTTHRMARPLSGGEIPVLDASNDHDYIPDQILTDDDLVEGPGWRLVAVETPGHMANHLAFSFPQEQALFSADHVMAWSTTVVAPPDGSMRAYMDSLDKLRTRNDVIYWPGHGGPVHDPVRYVRALSSHRRQREASILARLKAGDSRIPHIVAAIYKGLNPALLGAAGLSVFAHLESLIDKGLATADGPARLDSDYRAI